MKIFWLLGSYPPPYGGVAVFVKNLHKCLMKENVLHKMIINSSERYPGMENLKEDLLGYFFQLLRIKRGSCIIDSCNMFLEYPVKEKAKVWNFLLKVKKWKWIKIFHDGTLPARYLDFSKEEKEMFITSINGMKKILVVSDELSTWLKHDICYLGDVEIIESILPKDIEIKELDYSVESFIQEHEFIVTSIGTGNKEYGFQDVIAAVQQSKYRNQIGIVLVDGNFAEKNEVYLERIRNYKKLENVCYIEGGLDNEKTGALLSKSTVFVRGVHYESYGISRVEAVLAGIPVIATNVGETRGMLLYTPGDIQELKERLDDVLDGKSNIDLNEWKKFYEMKAENNYKIIKNIINGVICD